MTSIAFICFCERLRPTRNADDAYKVHVVQATAPPRMAELAHRITPNKFTANIQVPLAGESNRCDKHSLVSNRITLLGEKPVHRELGFESTFPV